MTINRKADAPLPVRWLRAVARYFDNDTAEQDNDVGNEDPRKIDWVQAIPFLTLHVACLAVFWVGWSWIAVATAVFLYAVRMFAITGFYHRYFSHRTFKTSRFSQFLFAALGNSAVQRGPLWWAAHHRLHHRHADQEGDAHSPDRDGFLWSHFLWFLTKGHFPTEMSVVRDLAKYKELRFLDRFDVLIPIMLGALTFMFGAVLNLVAPSLGTSGLQMLVWGFCISTVACSHATYTINSVSHLIGRRRYATKDTSKNNWFLAILTFGEGWHNNHHHYCASARQGFFWWEIDLTYYTLKMLSWLGIVWDLRPVPAHAKYAHRDSPKA